MRPVADRLFTSVLLADTVIEDKLGVLSLVRLIDTFNLTFEATAYDQDGNPTDPEILEVTHLARANLVVIVRQVKGEPQDVEFDIRVVAPDGKRIAGGGGSARVSPQSGMQSVVPFNIPVKVEGRYEFQVRINGRLAGCAYADVTIVMTSPTRSTSNATD